MTLNELSDIVAGAGRREALQRFVSDGSVHRSMVLGAAGSSIGLLMAALPKHRLPGIVIGDDADDAGFLYHDLSRVLGEDAVMMFPSGYRRSIKYGQIDSVSQIMRTETLNRWDAPELRYVVTYPEAIAEKVATRNALSSHTRRLQVGGTLDMTEFEQWLIDNGFRRTDYVYDVGMFAVRGSIIDVYAYSTEHPVRIDMFGDEIESIRLFNIETQLSESKLNVVDLTSEVNTGGSDSISLLDFVGKDAVLWTRDIEYCKSRIRHLSGETISEKSLLADDCDVNAMQQIVDADQLIAAIDRHRSIAISPAAEVTAAAHYDATLNLNCSPQGVWHRNFDLISDTFRDYISRGYRIFVLSDSEKQIARLRDIFSDREDSGIAFTGVTNTVHSGFVDNVNKICVFTDHQIFERFHKYNLRSDRARSGKLALSLKELGQIEVGDYVVHADHGVGRFGGLIRQNIDGKVQEMIKLLYAADDILLISIHSLHKLSKYRGKEGQAPHVSRLGSSSWAKIKDKTKSRLKDIARDLIKLYAARKDEKGFAFSPDGYLQNELEASFEYEDTPDQLTATQAVKADMESARPMDRLVCGDVGFGKTEIAIRAAFKAATDGKQTAVLVPTTVLAYQHYRTFSQRLKDFPVRVDYLSRARTAKETRQILADLAEGKIDILIGTHKLIGKGVNFHDLGLLVVDEEQKFGVSVKEKLKQLKVSVDTLTMSATPIPRTLQFSLMGARDLSAITTPPANRYPIVTSINTLTDELLVEAVNFEMSRNGQVFIVNPRIEGLIDLEAMVHRLIPDARTVVAHGQMPSDELEKTIIDFTNHDYDVMLATTIIESGIDMPNVNTIIINNAQNFGLSELHQLRGRVGRSNRKAFCYLMVPPQMPLTPVARRRLQAIESFSELGSGIHIAMQDLDIRGAGNLLGAEQSGFIADLGYETYQRVLKEAVNELRTEEFADVLDEVKTEGVTDEFVVDCVVESDMELLFPENYVPQSGERIALYKELDSIERDVDLDNFRSRLEDRFGRIPTEAEELLRVPVLRRHARRLGIEKVMLKQSRLYLYFVGESNQAYYQSPMFGRILHYLQDNPRRCRLNERAGRRSMVIDNVTTVAEGEQILRSIIDLEAL